MAKLSFKDIESSLEAEFNELMSHPEKFDLGEKSTEEIRKLSYIAKRSGWKLVQEKAKAMIQKQNSEELADSVVEDLQEDGVKIISLASLDTMLDHPEMPEFKLESAMVEHIKGLSSKEKEGLKHALAHDFNIDQEDTTEKSLGQKILDIFKNLWEDLAPVFSSMVLKLTAFASDAAGKAIEKHISEKMGEKFGKKVGEEVDKAVEGIGETIAERIETSSERIKEKEEHKSKGHVKTKSVNFKFSEEDSAIGSSSSSSIGSSSSSSVGSSSSSSIGSSSSSSIGSSSSSSVGSLLDHTFISNHSDVLPIGSSSVISDQHHD